ncbi:hypothetical protein ACTWP5_05840 [Streptomyces sp. 4N509B]|uniref:hypothetical protein n=1 Tax=Streptomyces sp. 4N509B TaxID=3457413 RepID=UPI003FD18D7D
MTGLTSHWTFRWTLRLLVVLGLLGSAWVHWVVWRDWARFDDVVGPLFVVNYVAGPVIALAVLGWHSHWLPEAAAVGFGAATLGGYLLSLTVGFFGIREQFRTEEEVWGVVTEAGCVVLGAVLLLLRWREARPQRHREGRPDARQARERRRWQHQERGQGQEQRQERGQGQGQAA